jgi:hypothetical protein
VLDSNIAESGDDRAVRSCVIRGDRISDNEDHGSGLVFLLDGCASFGLELVSFIVDGSTILNDTGTVCAPRTLILAFLITASPSVFGGDTLDFGKGPCQGFTPCLSDPFHETALIILVARGQRKSELVGDEKPTFSASCSSLSA